MKLADRLAGTDDVPRRMIRGATFTAGGALISRLVTLGAGVIAARGLGAAGFGTFSLCQSTASVATSVASLGLPWAANRMIAAYRVSDPRQAPRLWRMLALLCFASVASVALIAMWFGAPLKELIFGRGVDSAIYVLSIWLFTGLAVNNFSQAVLIGVEEFAVLTRWTIVRASVAGIGVVAGVFIGGTTYAVAGYAVGEYVVLLPMFRKGGLLVRRLCEVAENPGTTGTGTASAAIAAVPATEIPAAVTVASGGFWRLAMAAWASTLLLQPALWYAQVLLTRVPDGYAELGVFALAQRAVQAVVLLPASIATSSVPILTACWAANRWRDYSRAARRYAAGYLAYIVPVAVFAVATAPWTLRIFGGHYTARWPVFAVLVIAAVPMVLNNLLSTMAIAADRSGLWLFSDVSQAVALVGAAAWLVPALGGVGASLSFLLGAVATCLALAPMARGLRIRS